MRLSGTAKRVSWLPVLASVVLPCALLNAQAAAPQKSANLSAESITTFQSRSELVLVPVVVTDRHGGHIAGLKKEDFSLGETGADHTIAQFEEVGADNAPVAAPKLKDRVFSNERGATSAKQLVIVALDAINTPLIDQIRARKQILKFLSGGVGRDALISVVVLTPAGLKVVHDFTTDTSILIAAVAKLTGKSAFAEQIPSSAPVDDAAVQGEIEQLNAFADAANQSAVAQQRQLAIRWTYDALTQIADAYAGIPGRKSLIWVTAGFPFSLAANNNQIAAPTGDVSDSLYAYEQMWQALSHANFAVYPVDARGFVNPGVLAASDGARSLGSGKLALPNMVVTQTGAHDASLDTFRDLAAMTGGKAFFNTNDLSKSFREASSDSASYYLLGFYLGRAARPGWHDLKVKVNRPGTQVRARSGYLVATVSGSASRVDDVRAAVLSPFDSTVLPLEVRWTRQDRAPGASTTAVSFDVMLKAAALTVDDTDHNHVKFDVIAVAKRSDGTIAGTVQRPFEAHLTAANAAQFRQAGMVYDGKLELAAGNYLVRFVLQDLLTGRVGSVSAPLTIKGSSGNSQ